jgi:hypothetical protein
MSEPIHWKKELAGDVSNWYARVATKTRVSSLRNESHHKHHLFHAASASPSIELKPAKHTENTAF